MATEIIENPADYASAVAFTATPVNPDVEIFAPYPSRLDARAADTVPTGGRLLACADEYADAMWECRGIGQRYVEVCGEAAAREQLLTMARESAAILRADSEHKVRGR